MIAGAEEDTLRSGYCLVDVLECPVRCRYAVDQRNIAQRSSRIGREVTEVSARSDVNCTVRANIEGADRGTVRNANEAPLNAVIDENAVIVAYIDHAARILCHCPIVCLPTVFARGIEPEK